MKLQNWVPSLDRATRTAGRRAGADGAAERARAACWWKQLSCLAALGISPSLHAADIAWTGGAGPNDAFWNVSANWATGLPGTGDNALIGAAFTPIFNQGIVSILSLQDQGSFILSAGTLSVASSSFIDGTLTMSGGALAGTGAMTVGSASTWTGGAIGGNGGVVTFNGALALSGSATKSISTGTFNTAGTTTWSGNTYPGGNTISAGQVAINNSGVWLDQNTVDTTFGAQCCVIVAQFNNSGRYIKSGSSATYFDAFFNNTGLLEIDSGQLNFGAFLSLIGNTSNLALSVMAPLNNNLKSDFAGASNGLNVASVAALAGTITLDFDFRPTLGEVIAVFDYGSRTGTFASVVAAGLAAGMRLTPIYNATEFQVEVSAVPLPPTLWLFVAGLCGLSVRMRRNR